MIFFGCVAVAVNIVGVVWIIDIILGSCFIEFIDIGWDIDDVIPPIDDDVAAVFCIGVLFINIICCWLLFNVLTEALLICPWLLCNCCCNVGVAAVNIVGAVDAIGRISSVLIISLLIIIGVSILIESVFANCIVDDGVVAATTDAAAEAIAVDVAGASGGGTADAVLDDTTVSLITVTVAVDVTVFVEVVVTTETGAGVNNGVAFKPTA